MKQLILLVGLPYSGKSLFAESQLQWPCVNPDSVRLALTGQRYYQDAEPFIWAISKTMAKALFMAGHETVIVDATNNTEKRREFWKDPLWRRNYVVMDIAAEACIARAQKKDDQEIVPIIERMAEAQEYNGIYYGDGYTELEREEGYPMAEQVSRPDGLKDKQIYHNGYSLDR